MGDVITTKCVLKLSSDRSRLDYLSVWAGPSKYVRIPCRIKGQARIHSTPEWEYEMRGGRLYLQPSLLCTDTGFHTDYSWNVDFALCPNGQEAFDHFFAINPELKLLQNESE